MRDDTPVLLSAARTPVVLATMRELEIDHDRVNVNGGAIAVGHPLGGSGFRLVCGGGGQGGVLLLRRR